MKIIKKIYHWCSKTRLRKILSSVLALLMLLTSIKYIFLYPNAAKAADIFIQMDEGYGGGAADTNSTVTSGTVTNALWRTSDLCRSGKCLYFDGTGDYVSYTDNANFDMGAGDTVTIEGWFRTPDITSGTRTIIAKEEATGADGGYRIEMDSSGFVRFGIDNENTSFPSDSITTTVAFDDNKWHHFAAVKNGATSISLYMDGNLIGTDSSIQNDVSNNDTFYIGIYNGSSNGFSGFIDEIKVMRSARSAAEVKADFNESTPSRGAAAAFTVDRSIFSDGLIAYWKLDENTGTSVTDYSGNSNTQTLSASSWAQGKYGSAWNGDGGKWITTASDDNDFDFAAADEFTYSLWAKSDSASNPANNEFLIDKENSSAGYAIYFTTNGYPVFGIDDDATFGPDDSAEYQTDIYDGTWHHITAVKRGTTKIEIFVDGVLKTTTSNLTATGTLENTDFLTIGAQDNAAANDEFTGNIDEIRVFRRALSEIEVTNLYAWSAAPVGHWKMDENTGTSVNDVSGTGNTGTLSGTTIPTWIPGKYGSGTSFDGSSSYIAAGTGTSLQITNELTLSSWVKLNSLSEQNIIARNGDAGSYNYRLYINSSGKPAMEVSTDGTAVATGTATNALTTGTWYHISGVYIPSTSITIYVNGVQDGQETASIPASINNAASVALNLGTTNNGSGGVAGAAFVQECTNSSTSTSSLVITCSTTGGNLLVMMLQYNAGSSRNFTVADTGGNTWTQATNRIYDNRPSGIVNGGQVFYSKTTSADTSVTVTISGGAVGVVASLVEFSGIQTSPLDVTSGNQCNDATATNCSTSMTSNATATTAQAHELAVGFLGLAEDAATITGSGSGWTYRTKIDNGATVGLQAGYKVLTATGTETNTGTAGTADNWNAFVATFKSDTPVTVKYLSGAMDDAKIYNYARSPGQIVEDMNAGHPAPGSPVGSAVGYWKMDEGYGTTAYDSSINANNLTLSAESWTNDGKFEKAWNGTGSDPHLSRTDDPDFDFGSNQDFTLSAWVRSDSASNPAASQYILDKQVATNNPGYRLSFNTSGQPVCEIDDDTASFPEDSATGTTDYYDNTWHHLVCIRNIAADKLYLYVDGLLHAQDTDLSATGDLTNADSLTIGAQDTTASGTDDFAGDIDEVKIYRFALNQNQLKVEYNRGSQSVMGASSTDSSGNATWSALNAYCPPGQGSSCTGPVGEWMFDENTGSTANDTSDKENNATITGALWAPGKIGQALRFDGVDDLVRDSSVTSDIQIITNITVSLWLYAESVTDAEIITSVKGGGETEADNEVYLLEWDTTSGNDIRYQHENGAGVNNGNIFDTNLSLNTWYHITLIRDTTANTVNLYVNGLLNSGTYSYTNDPTGGTAADFRVGGNTATDFYHGSIDQVRIYNYVRSPAQIWWEFNQGKAYSRYKMDEGTGSTVNDAGGNSNTGTITIGAGGTQTTTTQAWSNGSSGKYSGSLNFDGTDDYVDLANDDNLDVARTDKFSVSAWVNPSSLAGPNAIIGDIDGSARGWEFNLLDPVSLDGNGIHFYLIDTWSSSAISVYAMDGGLSTSTWTHVAVTYDGSGSASGVKLYYNGKSVTTTTHVNNLGGSATTTNAQAAAIGRRASGGSQFSGKIDDVQVFKYNLNDTQILNLYNQNSAVRFGP